MDSLDLFLKKYSYKFPKGYPDINNKEDITLLFSILEELKIDLDNNKTQLEPVDKTNFGKYIFESFDKNVPPVKGEYISIENLKIDSEDIDNFKKLYEIIPAHNIGKGELALYWLFNYKDPNSPKQFLTENKVNNADFNLGDKKLEVKAYKSLNSKITLGKFKDDTESRNIINNIFGIVNLSKSIEKDKELISEITFSAETLKNSFEYLYELKQIFEDKKSLLEQFDLFNQLYENVSNLISSNLSPEELAKNTLISLTVNKLNKKPGLDQHLVNINPDLIIESVLIPTNVEDILKSKSFEEINKAISINSAEIQFNFSLLKN